MFVAARRKAFTIHLGCWSYIFNIISFTLPTTILMFLLFTVVASFFFSLYLSLFNQCEYVSECARQYDISFLTTVLSQWDFAHGKFGLLSPGKASGDRVALPNLRCMLSALVFP